MSFILLGILNSQAAGGGESYWLSCIGSTGADTAFGLAVDSSGAAYGYGQSNTGIGSNDQYLVKWDTSGAVQWQKALGATTQDFAGNVAVSSADDVYTIMHGKDGTTRPEIITAKYNSSGTLQWQRKITGNFDKVSADCATDSGNNVYSFFYYSTPSNDYCFALAKYNSSGVIQWQRELASSTSDSAYGISVDSSDNVYLTGRTRLGNNNGNQVAKYNSSGTLQWQKRMTGTSSEFGASVANDSDNNLYVVGDTYNSTVGSSDISIIKYNTSGSLQWQRRIGNSGYEQGSSITTDADNNVYVSGQSSDKFFFAKYNSGGSIQWQRTLSASEISLGIRLNPNGSLYVFGSSPSVGEGAWDFLIAKIPNDGSLTGTYTLDSVSVVYAAGSSTAATSSNTNATTSMVSSSISLANSASSLSQGTPSYTSHFVEIPA